MVGGIEILRRKAFIVILAALLAGSAASCRQDPPNSQGGSRQVQEDDPTISPVQGPAWLEHLGIPLSESSMGRMGGEASPEPEADRSEPDLVSMFSSSNDNLAELVDREFVLSGTDLYRLGCQSCHGLDGRGAPPEISSVISIVASLAALPKDQATQGLKTFLAKPGDKMPSFSSFRDDEVAALLQALENLAGTASEQSPATLVKLSAVRVGRHVVDGTCHICHSATGPGGGSMQMMELAVPSLASLPRDYPLDRVEAAVIEGVFPGRGGMRGMGMMGRTRGNGAAGTMPALPYLTRQEIAAAYIYLFAYPPESQ